MTKVIATPAVQDWLATLKGPAEIQDQGGRVLGHYTPALTPEEARFHAWVEQTFDIAAAERALAEKQKGYTLNEVKECLRPL